MPAFLLGDVDLAMALRARLRADIARGLGGEWVVESEPLGKAQGLPGLARVAQVEKRPAQQPVSLGVGPFRDFVQPRDCVMRWDPLESTCRHASLSIL